MKGKLRPIFCSFIFFLFLYNISNAQTFAGIEIGSKGVKMSVIDVLNAKKGIYTIKDFWTENAGIARGISIDGNLAEEDIDNATGIVLKNYNKIKNELKVDDKNIFIVASSGVGMAKNTKKLIDKVKILTSKNMEVISSQLEAKLLLKGCIPPKYAENSMILDIGGGNTKGGYVDTYNSENLVFFPLNLDLGTITLTEAVNKKIGKKDPTIFEFNEKTFEHLTEVRDQVAQMYSQRPVALEKKNIYLSGGAVWAFYTLFNSQAAVENFSELSFEDIIYHKYNVENNFKKYEEAAKSNTEVEKVLKTYSQKHLISATNLLISTLENIPNLKNKKIYFAKQGQIAWLLSYVADSAKGAKVIY